MGRSPALLVAVTVAALLPAVPAAAGPPPGPVVTYRAPVPGPVIDPYRPPSTPYGPGNRGLDYATTPGEPVAAAAAGEVTFAGPVGGGLHVVVLHADGIRTSLSFLAVVLVRRGQRVSAGQAVGLAGATLHFGARRGEAYLDPASLLSGDVPAGRAVLVPDGPGRPLGAAAEAAGLHRLLAGDRPPVPAAPRQRPAPPRSAVAAPPPPPALRTAPAPAAPHPDRPLPAAPPPDAPPAPAPPPTAPPPTAPARAAATRPGRVGTALGAAAIAGPVGIGAVAAASRARRGRRRPRRAGAVGPREAARRRRGRRRHRRRVATAAPAGPHG